MLNLAGKKVLVWGLGEFGGGLGAARYAHAQGASVKITDLKSASELSDPLKSIAHLPFGYTLGKHNDADLDDADIIVVNPAVKPDHHWIELAVRHHKVLTSEIELFLTAITNSTGINTSCRPSKNLENEEFPSSQPGFSAGTKNIIAVTGSAGKSTTVTLIHKLLQAHNVRSHLGGNIGTSLLNSLPEIHHEDWVVLELSSFQLHLLRNSRFTPRVAVVTSFFPNHLDWHQTTEHYLQSKQHLTRFQSEQDYFMRPDSIEATTSWPGLAQRLSPANACELLSIPQDLVSTSLKILGGCNQINATLAVLAVWSAGFKNVELIRKTLKGYTGLPHRMEMLRNHQGVTYINDSKSTTPESTIEALHAMQQPVILIAGGADKGVDLQEMIQTMIRNTDAAILLGVTGKMISSYLTKIAPDYIKVVTDNPQDAFEQASQLAKPGSVVLLSPGCASYGMFKNYEQRGNAFREYVNNLQDS